jgi:hypothetical protein
VRGTMIVCSLGAFSSPELSFHPQGRLNRHGKCSCSLVVASSHIASVVISGWWLGLGTFGGNHSVRGNHRGALRRDGAVAVEAHHVENTTTKSASIASPSACTS